MRYLRLGFVLVAMVVVATVAFGIKVETDYDHAANFSKYHTYSLGKMTSTGDPLQDQRITADVNATLAAKGFKKVDDGADMVVGVHPVVKQDKDLNTFYNGWGPGWGFGGFGSATTSVSTYYVGTLLIDIFDGKTKQLLYRSTATETLSENPDRNAKLIKESVGKMLQGFPPAPAKKKK